MCHALAGQMEQLDNRAEVHGTAMITEQHIFTEAVVLSTVHASLAVKYS